jgi:GGDEF domain-containing protein
MAAAHGSRVAPGMSCSSGRNERLAESASTDLLTGLPNRRMLDRALGRLSANDTVVMLDLDHFKQVNDNFGHAAGDEVLRVFGSVLRGTVRGRDTVGRFGGEEFLIVLAPGANAEATLLAADQAIFGDFLYWLQNLLVQRGVPPQALIAGHEALRPVVEAVDTGAALLLDVGRQELLDGLR